MNKNLDLDDGPEGNSGFKEKIPSFLIYQSSRISYWIPQKNELFARFTRNLATPLHSASFFGAGKIEKTYWKGIRKIKREEESVGPDL